MNLQITDLLNNAVNNIRRYGWVKHDFGNINRGFCLVGALRHGTDKSNEFEHTFLETLTLLSKLNKDRSMATLNDYYCESKDDALLVLTSAIKYVDRNIKTNELG